MLAKFSNSQKQASYLSNDNSNTIEGIEEVDVKLSVLELIVGYIDILIADGNLINVCYLSYDITKISSSIFINLIDNLNQFYNLNQSNFNYLKRIIGFINIKVVNFILEKYNDNNQDIIEFIKIDRERKVDNINIYKTLLTNYTNNSEFWTEIIKKINAGKYKKLFSFLQENFGVIDTTVAKKKNKKENKENKITEELSKETSEAIKTSLINEEESKNAIQV